MDQEYRKVKRTAIFTAILCIAVAIVIVTAPIGILMLSSSIRPIVRKQKIFNLVERNYEVILEACENQDAEALSVIDGIKDVDIRTGYVLVYCAGYGIAPSSQDYGFYYSRDNLPVAVFAGQIICPTSQLTEKGNGYEYIDSGYNVFYTEHIKGNIYFYSASF